MPNNRSQDKFHSGGQFYSAFLFSSTEGVFLGRPEVFPTGSWSRKRFANEARDSLATNRANESGGSGDRDPEQAVGESWVRVPRSCASGKRHS